MTTSLSFSLLTTLAGTRPGVRRTTKSTPSQYLVDPVHRSGRPCFAETYVTMRLSMRTVPPRSRISAAFEKYSSRDPRSLHGRGRRWRPAARDAPLECHIDQRVIVPSLA